MISVDGASVLAQVLPVGILLVALELRRVQFYAGRRFMTVLMRIGGAALFATVVACVQAVVLCVTSVATGRPLDGFAAVFVWVSATALSICVQLLLAIIVADALGFLDWMSRRAIEAMPRDPESAVKTIDYITATYPEAQRVDPATMENLRQAAAFQQEAREISREMKRMRRQQRKNRHRPDVGGGDLP